MDTGNTENVEKNNPYSQSDDKEQDKKLLLPFAYIQHVSENQMQEKIVHAFNYWLKIPQEKLQIVGDIIHMLYYSALLMDDIQDNSILRGGIPVSHSIYGIASTINAANYVVFIALEKILSLKHAGATQIYTEQLLELFRGQGMEIYWRDNFICPSESEYQTMAIQKSGGFFNLIVRLMQLFSECEKDFAPLVDILGFYYQIQDDYYNLCSRECTESKSYCEDLSEGKFSFPIIHAIKNHPEDNQVFNILKQRTEDVEVKRYCVNLLEKFGSFDYTRSVLFNLNKQAKDEVQRLGGNPYLISFLDKLFDSSLYLG